MSKKKVTAEQVKECIDRASEASVIAIEVGEAISKCKIDPIPDAIGAAREMIVAARDLSQLALKLFSLHDLQTMRAKTAELRTEANSD